MILYRFVILSLLAPVFAGKMAARLMRGRERPADLGERLGRGTAPVARGPVIWLHAASVGEAVAARSLAEALLDRDQRLQVVMSTNSTTGRARVQSWANPRIAARLAPVDTRWALARFVGAWQPAAVLTIENELWPNRFALARAGRMPVLVASARMSEGSARMWGRFPRTAREVLGLIDHAAAQDAASAARLVVLGLDDWRLGPELNLKALVRTDRVEPDALAPFMALPRERTILAASTHPGEEEVVLQGFARAAQDEPGLRLILAPRHPERGDEVARLIQSAGFSTARRSKGALPDEGTRVYLADTLGEMPLWLSLAAVTFVGGSLIDKGGHTPYEPAQASSAIVHGPYVGNHAAAYETLAAYKGARTAADPAGLADAFVALIREPEVCAAQAERARSALGRLGSGSKALDAFVIKLGELTGNPALQGKR